MDMMELLQIDKQPNHWSIDARDAITSGHHPRQAIVSVVKEAPSGTLCEVHLPHRAEPLMSALKGLGLNVTVSQASPGHWLLRVLKF